MRKGIAPVYAFAIVICLMVAVLVFTGWVKLMGNMSRSDVLKLFEVVDLKNAFRLTIESLEGGLKAITSEAVFHPFDVGLPDRCDPSCYVVLNSKATTTTVSGTTTTLPATTTTIGLSAAFSTMFSYMKYPMPWINDTIAVGECCAGTAAWTVGIISYPEFAKDGFTEYVKTSIKSFVQDHLATSFTQPFRIYLEYEFSDVSVEPSSVSFDVKAKINASSLESSIQQTDLGTYSFSYPLSVDKMFGAYEVAKRIPKGFEAGEIDPQYQQKNFSYFVSQIASGFSLPIDPSDETSMESGLETEIGNKLDAYAAAINSAPIGTGYLTEIFHDDRLFAGNLKTFIETDFRRKYMSYLVNYTVLVNITDPSASKFCCNWNPISNKSSREIPGLRFLMNDTFLALECDDSHASAIWSQHRDDYEHLICEKVGGTLSWNNLSSYPEEKDMLLDLKGSGRYDSLWDASEQKWYRCGYSLGDVIRVDGMTDNELLQSQYSGEIAPDEIVENQIKPYPNDVFDGFYDSAATSLVSSGGTEDRGSVICYIKDRTQATDTGFFFADENQWLRCFNDVQDFKKLSVYNEFTDQFDEKYCCMAPDETSKYICSIDEQKDYEYCCECFGHEWAGSSSTNGYCIGDGLCERKDGETTANSWDCCQSSDPYVPVDPTNLNYYARLNPGTEADLRDDNVAITNNRCGPACPGYTGKIEPTCSGNTLIKCDNSETNCGEPFSVCVGCGYIPIDRGCGPSRMKMTPAFGGGTAPGYECYWETKPYASCGVHACVQDGNNAKCDPNSCSMACGANCQIEPDGKTTGCDDVCGTVNPTILSVSRTCNTATCTCGSGTDYVCSSATPPTEKDKVCGGSLYKCLSTEGIYRWEYISEAP